MNTDSYKYDVAFSFLAEDESLATELNDLLQDRLKTFLYSKCQGDIAATDGEQTFNKVFGEEARVVVVLYRTGWGESPWTRIEQTAIHNRGYEHGYEFVIFIPLDDQPSVPKWLPRTRLWMDIKRWGASGTASVIEARIQECGGEPREESVQDRAERLARSLKFKAFRDRFLNSGEGISAANEAFEKLWEELQRLTVEIKTSENPIALTPKRAGTRIVILGFNIGLSIVWHRSYSNTLSNSELIVEFWDGHPYFPGSRLFDEPERLNSLKFSFDISVSEEYIWCATTSDARQYSSKELASFILKRFMDEGLQQSINQR